MDALWSDILDQPRALRAALAATRTAEGLPRARDLCRAAPRILLTGMGASYFATYPAFLRLLASGAPVARLEAGELLHQAPGALDQGTAVIAVSQSGRSAEVVRLLEARGRATIIGVTNDPTSPLATTAEVSIPLSVGPEGAGVATKTFTGSLLWLDLLLADGGGAGWPEAIDALEHVLRTSGQWLPGLRAALGMTEHVWFLGRGALLATACAAGLMFKEAAGLHGEGLSTPQFRHGPLELAGPGRSALVLVSPGPLGRLDLDLAGEMAAAGMGVAAIHAAGSPPDPVQGVHSLHWPSLPAQPAVLAAAVQCLAHAAALRLPREPGTFSRIGKVTTRE
jgi:glucosamine--fructose-6-phosphate aminotransferase (isomerizing)